MAKITSSILRFFTLLAKLSRSKFFCNSLLWFFFKDAIFFDTCYSGQTRSEETLIAGLRPVRLVVEEQDIPNNFTIFSASSLTQTSGSIEQAKHGIFSYYLMKGLEGKADSNNDKKITNGELLAYMDENVSQKASELGRQQNPSLTGDPDKPLTIVGTSTALITSHNICNTE